MGNDLKQLEAPLFPALLREIPDPPKTLYVRGSLPSDEAKWLAVVGSRACTPYGRQAVAQLIEGLRGYPIVIVSGLAYGIDAEAHKAALRAGLRTVAVPGSGLDWSVMYPRAHVQLAREIVKSGGALISEYDPMQRAADYTFPRRNRIMAGLSHATLLIEAKQRSGTLITARLAAEYNREVLGVPGSIFSESSAGVHQFLRLGATVVTSSNDILEALGERIAELPAERIDLSEDERRVMDLLSAPLSRDALLEELSMPVSDAHILLSTMEIRGLIVEEHGMVRTR